MRQFEMAMEQGSAIPRFQGILSFFWGLIFAKLFLLEYWIQLYEVPLNSTFYIWTLTLVMGVLCSAVLLKIARHGTGIKPLTGKMVRSIWLGCFLAIAIGALAATWFESVSPYLQPGYFSLILGVGFMSHSALNGRKRFRFLALAWWVAAVVLLSRNAVINYAWFAGFLVVLHVIPTATFHFIRPLSKSVEAPSYSI